MTRPRLALTTTEDRIASLAPRVEELGLEAVSLPCIECVPAEDVVLDSARDLASRCDWLVVTSARAVATLWPDGDMPDVSVAVVGPATAAAVEAAGGTTRVVGQSGAGELIRSLITQVEGQTVFLPHATGADPAQLTALESAAGRFETRVVYEVRPVAPTLDPTDAVAFGSPTAVEGWSRSRALSGLTVGAIGTTTAEALAERGVVSPIVPDQPSFDRLIGVIAEEVRYKERSAL